MGAWPEIYMAIRFRKRIKIAPGLSVNIGKKGVTSVSIGGKGVTLNTGGKRGTSVTTSIPGTGLSANHKISGGRQRKPSTDENPPAPSNGMGVGGLLVIGVVLLMVFIAVFG